MESTLGTEWSKLQCDWGILLPHTKKGLMCWKGLKTLKKVMVITPRGNSNLWTLSYDMLWSLVFVELSSKLKSDIGP